MKNYRIYINQQGWEIFTVVNSERQAGFMLNKLDEREVHSLVVEHDFDKNQDTACTSLIRQKYLKSLKK